jgi:hypothetical protein
MIFQMAQIKEHASTQMCSFSYFETPTNQFPPKNYTSRCYNIENHMHKYHTIFAKGQ